MAELGTDNTDVPAPASPGEMDALAAALKEISGPSPVELGTGGPGNDEAVPAKPRTYAPEEVVDLVTLPAETMFALTGSRIWILEENEKKILAEKTAKALSIIMQIEPKWFIGISFAATVSAVYGTRTIAYLNERKEKKKDEKV
jgi:hypothetical protein